MLSGEQVQEFNSKGTPLHAVGYAACGVRDCIVTMLRAQAVQIDYQELNLLVVRLEWQ